MTDQYNSLVKTRKWVGNNPITLKVGDLKEGGKYYVTDKLDGVRRLLLFKDSRLYNVSSKLEFQEFKLTKGASSLSEKHGFLIDCEFYKKKYYAFDILYSNGVDIRQTLGFSQRQDALKKVLKTVNSKRLVMKEFHLLKCPEILTSIKNKVFGVDELDGLIIVPDSYYKDTVFKWKPSSLLSNDFKVRKTKNSLLLLLQNNQVFERKAYPGIGEVPYTGTDIKDGDIVEFVYENDRFKPLRTRPDKTKSNHISVILDNFKQMTNPSKLSKLFCFAK